MDCRFSREKSKPPLSIVSTGSQSENEITVPENIENGRAKKQHSNYNPNANRTRPAETNIV